LENYSKKKKKKPELDRKGKTQQGNRPRREKGEKKYLFLSRRASAP